MIIILVAVLLFALGLGMILMFRSVIEAEDELDRAVGDAIQRLGDLEERDRGPAEDEDD